MVLSLGAGSVMAQKPGDIPRRPRLPDGADSNSAASYRSLALQKLQSDPDKAADALYWATRLEPTTAEFIWGYRAALLLADRQMALDYLTDDPGIRHRPQARLLDSLNNRARMLDPFLRPWLDDVVITELVKDEARRSVRQAQGEEFSESELDFEVRAYLSGTDSPLSPYLEFARGHLAQAIGGWQNRERREPRNAGIHIELARAFATAGLLDSARNEMTNGLELLRTSDTTTMRLFYNSKASLEYFIGRVDERRGQPDSARAAYERALVEDLSYYPAHVQLGRLAYMRGDTAANLQELARAVDVKGDDYVCRLVYGSALAAAHQLDSAVVHLRRAIDLEPWAARPRIILAVVLENQGNHAAATESYRAFAERAARNDPMLPTARARSQTPSP
ncbi:MAG TPA: hypothetical protein VGI92_08835 [Gemmatimonadales bacterium]